MSTIKPVHEGANDVVKRFCPHIRENVLMLKSVGEDKARFECLSESSCRKKAEVQCLASREAQD